MTICDRCLVSGCCLTPNGKACKSARERECPDVVFTNADRIRGMDDEELAFYLSEFWATSPRAWQKDYGETLTFLRQSASEMEGEEK